MIAPAGQDQDFPGTRRLWSLWDMLSTYGELLVETTKLIVDLSRSAETVGVKRGGDGSETFPAMPEKDRSELYVPKLLKRVTSVAEGLGLSSVLAQVKRLEGMFDTGFRRRDFEIALAELQNRLRDDISGVYFYYMKPEMVRYCTDSTPFGPEVHEKFPSAIDDIEGAAKCLAFGQGTAVVLHLMRVMEVGLRALSKALGIPYAPSWESHLTQINNKITQKHRTKGVKWKRDEPFFRDVAGDLQIVKIAWRNPTMHVVRKYGPDEAEEIFRAVRGFMKRLATRLSY